MKERRVLLAEPFEAMTLRYRARLLRADAAKLKSQLRELEEKIEGTEGEAEKLELEAKRLHSRIVPFVETALAEESRLGWCEIQTLRAALDGEMDMGELLHIGLALSIEIPADLMPGAVNERRAA